MSKREKDDFFFEEVSRGSKTTTEMSAGEFRNVTGVLLWTRRTK